MSGTDLAISAKRSQVLKASSAAVTTALEPPAFAPQEMSGYEEPMGDNLVSSKPSQVDEERPSRDMIEYDEDGFSKGRIFNQEGFDRAGYHFSQYTFGIGPIIDQPIRASNYETQQDDLIQDNELTTSTILNDQANEHPVSETPVDIYRFNDHPTAEEVFAMVEKAEQAEREDAQLDHEIEVLERKIAVWDEKVVKPYEEGDKELVAMAAKYGVSRKTMDLAVRIVDVSLPMLTEVLDGLNSID